MQYELVFKEPIITLKINELNAFLNSDPSSLYIAYITTTRSDSERPDYRLPMNSVPEPHPWNSVYSERNCKALRARALNILHTVKGIRTQGVPQKPWKWPTWLNSVKLEEEKIREAITNKTNMLNKSERVWRIKPTDIIESVYINNGNTAEGLEDDSQLLDY